MNLKPIKLIKYYHYFLLFFLLCPFSALALSGLDSPAIENIPSFKPDSFSEETSHSAHDSKLALNVGFWNETAYRIGDPHGLSKIKSGMDLKISHIVSPAFSLTLSGKAYYDAVFDTTDYFTENVENDQEFDIGIREAYLDFGMGDLEIRLGRQQIVWGQAVGLFIADIVNPKDLREYILPDLDDIRIPAWAVNLEYYKNNSYVQFVFIPIPEFNEFGEPGSEFDFSRMGMQSGGNITQMAVDEPSHSIKNSKWGFRGAHLVQGWDLAAFFMYDFDAFPVNYRSIETSASGSSPIIRFMPKYERVKRVGFTFSKDLDGLIFKGESVYSIENHFSVADEIDSDGIVEKDSLDYLIGMDYTFLNRIDTNFQFIQTIIFDHEDRISQKEVSSSVSFWMSFGMFNDKVEPELFFVTSIDREDYLVRPKLIFNVNTHLSLTIGADIFEGDSDGGTFGFFDDNDRVYVSLYYAY